MTKRRGLELLTIVLTSLMLVNPGYSLRSQDIWFNNFNVSDGLSVNDVECLLQDSLGLIWLGTRDGLNSFDGYSFTKYKELEGPKSLKKSIISCLYLDRTGNIWIGSIAEGISVFLYKEEKFIHLNNSGIYPVNFDELTIYDIKGDKHGNIWIASQEGLFCYSLEQSNVTGAYYCGIDKNSRKLIIRCLSFDNEDRLWAGTENDGLKICNLKDNSFIDLKRNSFDDHSLSSNGVKSLYFENDSIMWIGTMDRGLNRLNIKTYKNQRIDISAPENKDNAIKINRILRYRKNELWICTENYGLKRYVDKTQTVTTYLPQEFRLHGISGKSISDIIEDRNGLLWIGERFSGFDVFYPKNIGFYLYKHIPNDGSSLSNDNVKTFCEDSQHRIWVGTDGGGIDIFDAEFRKIRSLNSRNAPFRFNSNVAMSIVSDQQGKIWIATWGDGLIKYDPDKNTYTQYINSPGNSNSISSNFLVNLFCDGNNNLWISCFSEGLMLFRQKDQVFIPVISERTTENTPDVYYITRILKDSKGKLWMTTFGNGIIVNKGDFSYTIKHDDYDPASLSSNFVHSIFEDSKQRIWIGTGEKLNLYLPDSNNFQHYGARDGFCNESIYDIEEDSLGFLWLSTNAGLIRFNPDSNQVQNFDKRYQVQESQFNENAGIMLSDGTLLFGGIGGFNLVDPGKVDVIRNEPKMILKNLLLYNEIQLPGAKGSPISENINFSRKINLSHKQGAFTIEYVGINYLSSDKTEYAYFLEGFSKDWNYVGNKRSASFTNLKPGTYVFKVKARNENESWGQDYATLVIHQKPPYWKTKLAFVVYFLFIILTYILFRRVILIREKEKSAYQFERYKVKKREELDNLRLRFFTNVSHELRTPLTLILAPLEHLIKKERNPDKLYQFKVIEKNASRLLKLINQIMDLRKQETGNLKLELRYGDLRRFIEQMLESYEDMAHQRNIHLGFVCKEEKVMLHFDQDKIDKVVFNLLSNAFKYTTDGGSITICIDRDPHPPFEIPDHHEIEIDGYVVISVRDTGCGIAPEERDKIFMRFYQGGRSSMPKHEGTGIGLSLTKDFIELHNGRILVESEYGMGATFHAYLPVVITSSEYALETLKEDSFSVLQGIDHVDQKLEHELRSKIKPTLLIVEDSFDLRNYIYNMLSGKYLILEADDGKKGLDLAISEIPDLIVSDIMMPGMDGFQLCEKLKTDERTSHIPVILLTAKTSETNRVEGLQAGADDYITKPFNFEVLELKIINLLEERKMLKDKYRRRVVIEGSEIEIENEDEKFLKKALVIVERNIGDPEFSVEVFSQEIGLSRVHLYRKLHALIEESPGDFIKRIRLERAAQLLAKSKKNVSEICYEVGFKDPVYFAKCFKKTFNKSPSAFQEDSQV